MAPQIVSVRQAVRDRMIAMRGRRTAEIACRYFVDRQTMRQIGAALGLTESRVCQILATMREWVPALIREEIAEVAAACG